LDGERTGRKYLTIAFGPPYRSFVVGALLLRGDRAPRLKIPPPIMINKQLKYEFYVKKKDGKQFWQEEQ